MHEAVIAKAIISAIKKECKTGGIKTLKSVYIEIGELRNVVPVYLQTAYRLGTKNTALKTSRLKIRIMPSRMLCVSCGATAKTAKVCSKCKSAQIEIVSGFQLKIVSISGDK